MLTVNEIYLSIQGESTHVGRPCTFVRLTACDLRCSWCDTPYAFTEGHKMTVDAVVAEVARLGCRLVEMTGGEPMLQADIYPLMETLIQSGYEVLVETGGHVPLARLPKKVKAIIDVKCPGSGEEAKMHWSNLGTLKPTDEVKFVLKDRADFDYALPIVRTHRLTERAAAVLFSPVHGVLAPDALAAWILETGLPIRLQLQAHKYIWRPDARGV
jgi:7-carboxy-7-deazaguanine synthase